MANNASKVRGLMDKYGIDEVENFIDVCLSLENLIDRYRPYVPAKSARPESDSRKNPGNKLRVDRDYMEGYINPPEFIEQQRRRAQEEEAKQAKFPPQPEKDILLFLMYYAPLKSWQQEVLAMIREEAYYFAPQGMTKIMNEGWASYWHSKMMTTDIATSAEIIDYADHHSGTMAMSPTGFNPYKVGIELFRDIEERWDKGQFGKEWNECDDIKVKMAWDKKLGLGRKKIYEVRRDYNDVTFIDEFLTEDFCVKNRMFVYKFNQRTGHYEIESRNFPAIKKQLLFHLTNFGQPSIQIEDANFENRGELLISHSHEGVDMQPNYMEETLKNIFRIWQRPVNLITVMDGERHVYSFNGKDYKDSPISELPK